MKHDFFAEYTGRWQGHKDLDQFAQVQLLAEALMQKTEAQQLLKDWILQKKLDSYFESQRRTFLGKIGLETESSLQSLPSFSFVLQFTFELRKPYLSKDEQDFYILDNPVRKDKVFKLPYVAPSSWKGSLRSAMRFARNITDEKAEKNDAVMMRLFGPVKGEEDEEAFRQGRLHFFPTFFTQIGLEVINPHDREKGAGKKPIFLESVPIGAEGTFTLLYVPFDRIGNEEADPERSRKSLREEVAEDLKIVAQGVKAMFTQYGFGAKTSSGFGVVNIHPNTVIVKVKDDPPELKEHVAQAEGTLREVARD